MNKREIHRSILLFVRYPEKGRVKTRLEMHVNQDKIFRLYKYFVEDILATLLKSDYPVTVCHLPPERGAEIQAWLGPEPDYIPQTGKDLGQRMENTFVKIFTAEASPADQAILLGSDFPDLDLEIIHQAFDALLKNDMALGPAVDGGYYLIGFNRHTFYKDVFAGISWGTRQVFKETMEKNEHAGMKVHLLPEWRDIDTYGDLKQFYRKAMENGRDELKTIRYLGMIMGDDWAKELN